jgi:Holliday junction resolvase
MSSRRGINRERQLKARLEGEDWFVTRAAGSLGDADLVALKDGKQPLLIEVKSTTAGPFHSFGPQDRAALLLAAKIAGARAVLCWWPPRRDPVFIYEHQWPGAPSLREAA